MRIKYVKLSNNGYLVSIPVKNGQTIRINIDIKNKLLSIDFCDITYIMFFKKVQVILKKLPIYLKEIDIEINQEGNRLFNFFLELDDRSYFKDSQKIRGFIKVNYIKLSDNIYQTDVIVKKSPIPIISYINVN